jgi:predicted permease
MVAGNFFHVLGVEPVLGRQFRPEESVRGGPPAVMLSYPFWRRQFAGDRSIVGKSIELDGKPVTVAGVLPESFDFGAAFSPGEKVDILTPLVMDDIRFDGNTLAIIGRLKPGVMLEQSRAEAKTLFPQFYWGKRFADSKGNYTAYPVFLKEYVSGKLRRSLIVLWCAVGLILLIVCVNLSNLLLARSAARSKEFALRSALGAGRGRLIRQLLTRRAWCSRCGRDARARLAYAMLRIWRTRDLRFVVEQRLAGWLGGGWSLLITVSTAILFGLVPGMKASRANVQEALKDGSHGTTEGRQHEKMRTVLVVSEVALACILLVGAGLLMRSFLRVLDVDLGFQPKYGCGGAQCDYEDGGKAEADSDSREYRASHNSARRGVVGFSDNLPLDRNRSWKSPRIKEQELQAGELLGRSSTSSPWAI